MISSFGIIKKIVQKKLYINQIDVYFINNKSDYCYIVVFEINLFILVKFHLFENKIDNHGSILIKEINTFFIFK